MPAERPSKEALKLARFVIRKHDEIHNKGITDPFRKSYFPMPEEALAGFLDHIAANPFDDKLEIISYDEHKKIILDALIKIIEKKDYHAIEDAINRPDETTVKIMAHEPKLRPLGWFDIVYLVRAIARERRQKKFSKKIEQVEKLRQIKYPEMLLKEVYEILKKKYGE